MRALASISLLSLLVSRTAAADLPVYDGALPDLELRYTSIDTRPGDVRALGAATIGGGARSGARPTPTALAMMDLLFGYAPTLTDRVAGRSSITLEQLVGDEPAAAELSGRHQLSLRWGAGGFEPTRPDLPDARRVFEEGGHGVDVGLESRYDHGRSGPAIARDDIGSGDFHALDGELSIGVRRALAGEAAIVWKTAALIRPSWLEEGLRLRYGASTGLGLRDHMRYVYHGWLELLGLGWERFEPAGSSGGHGVDRLEIRLVHLDDVVFRDQGVFGAGAETLFFTAACLGAQWLTSGDGAREKAIFAFDGSAGARFTVEEADADLALAVVRAAEPTPVTQHFVDRWRLEGRAGLNLPGDASALVVAGGRWQRSLEDDTLATGRGVFIASSAWLGFGALDAGLYHRSATGWSADGDAFTRTEGWQHDAGLFVRIGGGQRGRDRYESGPAGFSFL